MDFGSAFQVFGISLQVFLVDVLLSGDNAVVIALACRTLPAAQRRQAMLYGAGAGIVLRLILAPTVGLMLRLPLLKIAGAVALLLIAIDLMTQEEEISENLEGPPAAHTLSAAVATIVTADLVMSLDNVVALAAVSQGSVAYLALGLILSVPLLMFGSGLLSRLMDEMPELITLGGALLGWVAGSIAVTDPLIAHWVHTQSPALSVAVPLAAAILTVMQSRRLVAERRLAGPRTRQPLKLPSIQFWPAGREAKPPAPEPAAAEMARPAMPAASEAGAEPVAALFAGHSAAVAMEDELAVLIGDGRRTPAANEPETIPAGTPSGPAKSAHWDIKIALGLAIFVMLLVIVMASVDDVMDNPDTTAPVATVSRTTVAPHLKRYQCDLYGTVFLYNHGSMQVGFQAGSYVLSGVLNRNTITWNKKPGNAWPFAFMPPTTVMEDDAKTITIDGLSFPKVVCRLGAAGTAGS